jgi:hypothetical protein
MEEEAYTICLAALRECGEQGWMTATFTPKGLTHWTYERFGKPQPDTELFHSQTRENKFLPVGFQERLEQQYSDSFARQELGGEFVALEGAEWPAEHFDRPDFWFTDWPDDLTVRTLALDPSKGRSDKPGDYSAFCRYGRDRHGIEYAECDLQRIDSEQIVANASRHVRDFRPDGFAIEANAFQFLFRPMIERRMAEDRCSVTLYEIDNTVSKHVRIRRLTEPLRKRCIRFRDTPGTRLAVAQMRDFPLSDHDDGIDSLEMARRLAIDLHNDGAIRR